MPNAKDVMWFKSQFGEQIVAAIAGTPFSLDMVTAIACQETGYIWQVLRKKLDTADEVLALCVGDTIDASGGRSAFPKNKAALIAKARGAEMFAIARDALEQMAPYISGYGSSVANPDKFCRGYGIFQYDLQFFVDDPEFFLEKKWTRFESCLAKFLTEIKRALQKCGFQDRTSLSDLEMAYVAIAYNKGSFDPSKGLQQGHKSDGKYYGECIVDFIRLPKSVPWPPSADEPEEAIPATGIGSVVSSVRHKVIARDGLKLREGPGTQFPTARLLPFGALVSVLRKDAEWALVDLEGDGRADGHMHAAFLQRA